MTSWPDLHNEIHRIERYLDREGYYSDAIWPADRQPASFAQWLKDCDAAVTICIEHYLQTGSLSDLARDEKPALFYRLGWAGQLLILLSFSPRDEMIVPNPRERVAALQWILIDSWKLMGLVVVARYMGLSGGTRLLRAALKQRVRESKIPGEDDPSEGMH